MLIFIGIKCIKNHTASDQNANQIAMKWAKAEQEYTENLAKIEKKNEELASELAKREQYVLDLEKRLENASKREEALMKALSTQKN